MTPPREVTDRLFAKADELIHRVANPETRPESRAVDIGCGVMVIVTKPASEWRESSKSN